MQKCEFLGHPVSFDERMGQDLPMDSSFEKVSNVGKKLLENYVEIARTESWLSHAHKEKIEKFFEDYVGFAMPTAEEFAGMKTEDLTFPNNTALYTTVVRNIVERAFRPTLVMNEIIRTITVNPKGMDKLKIPISVLKTAAALPSNGELTAPTGGNYTYAEIELGWIYAYEVITLQIIQQGIIDIVQDQMIEIGDALARKVDADIITAIETATPSDGSNSNYTTLSSTVTYSDLVTGVMTAISNYALPDAIVTNSLTWANFLTNSNVITALGYNSVEKGSIFPRIQDFLGLKVVLTPQASSGNIYIVDTQRCKYLVEASGIQMIDGRKSETVNWEVIGLKCYGVTIVQEKAVYRLVETTGS